MWTVQYPFSTVCNVHFSQAALIHRTLSSDEKRVKERNICAQMKRSTMQECRRLSRITQERKGELTALCQKHALLNWQGYNGGSTGDQRTAYTDLLGGVDVMAGEPLH